MRAIVAVRVVEFIPKETLLDSFRLERDSVESPVTESVSDAVTGRAVVVGPSDADSERSLVRLSTERESDMDSVSCELRVALDRLCEEDMVASEERDSVVLLRFSVAVKDAVEVAACVRVDVCVGVGAGVRVAVRVGVTVATVST